MLRQVQSNNDDQAPQLQVNVKHSFELAKLLNPQMRLQLIGLMCPSRKSEGQMVLKSGRAFAVVFLKVPPKFMNESRKMPIMLPHRLLPWLVRSRVFPETSPDEVTQFWNHLRDVSCSYSATSDCTHPCWLWGDDCVFDEQNHKLVVVCMVSILDTRTVSWETCWPLFVYRADPWQKLINSIEKQKSKFVATQYEDLSVGFPTLQAYLGPDPWQHPELCETRAS